jgi:integrase
LEWTDLDQERNKVTIKASKNGNSRTIPISKNLIERLIKLPNKNRRVFPKRSTNARTMAFRYRMKSLARLHDNPRFLKIHCHTFRHCKALIEYNKTKSIMHVKRILGHKSIMTTQIYVELYEEIYGDLKPENFISAVASTQKERRQLIESGFEWIGQDNDGLTYFRKPIL